MRIDLQKAANMSTDDHRPDTPPPAPPPPPPPPPRRKRPLTGSNTCDMPQPEHRERRGRTSIRTPSAPRRPRERAHPHGASTPPHSGQTNSPATSRRSTSP